jgi:hypothetical protein
MVFDGIQLLRKPNLSPRKSCGSLLDRVYHVDTQDNLWMPILHGLYHR